MYSTTISGWDDMDARQKFQALALYQKKRPKKKRERRPKEVKEKPVFSPPSGYYQSAVLCERHYIGYSTLKRYVSSGNVREYRLGFRVAYCEYDMICERERCDRERRENGRRTGRRNRREILTGGE